MAIKKITDEALNKKINQALFLLNACLFALDELESTSLFKHSLKAKIKSLSSELEFTLKTPMKSACDSNHESYQKFMISLESISKLMSELSVFQLGEAETAVTEIKNKY